MLIAPGLFIYAPPLQAVFGSVPLGWDDLLTALVVGFLIKPLIGPDKWLMKRLGKRPQRVAVVTEAGKVQRG